MIAIATKNQPEATCNALEKREAGATAEYAAQSQPMPAKPMPKLSAPANPTPKQSAPAQLEAELSVVDRFALKTQADLYHRQGYNCAQAVICTLAPQLGVDTDAAFRLAEGFGLGMGGMSETCGAISGAVMAVGQATSTGTADPTSKGRTYQLSREIARRFREKNGTTVCRELKGIGTDHGPLRPCPGCIDDAIDIAIDVIDAARGRR